MREHAVHDLGSMKSARGPREHMPGGPVVVAHNVIIMNEEHAKAQHSGPWCCEKPPRGAQGTRQCGSCPRLGGKTSTPKNRRDLQASQRRRKCRVADMSSHTGAPGAADRCPTACRCDVARGQDPTRTTDRIGGLEPAEGHRRTRWRFSRRSHTARGDESPNGMLLHEHPPCDIGAVV